MAAAAREAGYDGVDLNVRPGGQGHVTPERVKQDLAPFVAAVRKAGIEVSAITPPIADADSPFAEDILAAASAIGITHYWWGTYRYENGKPIQAQLDALKPRVAKLAALNAKYKMTAMYHTYAGNAVGTPVWDLLSILEGPRSGAGRLSLRRRPHGARRRQRIVGHEPARRRRATSPVSR